MQSAFAFAAAHNRIVWIEWSVFCWFLIREILVCDLKKNTKIKPFFSQKKKSIPSVKLNEWVNTHQNDEVLCVLQLAIHSEWCYADHNYCKMLWVYRSPLHKRPVVVLPWRCVTQFAQLNVHLFVTMREEKKNERTRMCHRAIGIMHGWYKQLTSIQTWFDSKS